MSLVLDLEELVVQKRGAFYEEIEGEGGWLGWQGSGRSWGGKKDEGSITG